MTTTIPPANFPDPFALLLDPLAAATPAAGGTYSAAVNRQRPACILFVCDQSASMDEPFRNDQMKARALAQTVNPKWRAEQLLLRRHRPQRQRQAKWPPLEVHRRRVARHRQLIGQALDGAAQRTHHRPGQSPQRGPLLV